jgi:hypothetical protein
MNFTLQELREEVSGLPPDGFFDLKDDVIYYEFICDKTFQIDDHNYETIDVKISSTTWMAVTAIDSLEEINKSIASGEYSHFRYIALTN